MAFLLKKNNIDLIQGFGRLTAAGRLEVDGTHYEADHIILATGARPREMAFMPVDGRHVISSRQALALTRLPAKYVVLPAEHKKPMLSLYQARYDGDVTTQVIYACKAVMDAPRHGAAQPGLASDRG